MAWGFGRYAPEAPAGRTRDSKKTPLLRNGGREALAPALSTKTPAPYDSKRTGRAPRPGHLFSACLAWFLFSRCGLPPFQPRDSFAVASLCGDKEGRVKKVSPGPFWLRRLLSSPGNKKTFLNDHPIWRWVIISWTPLFTPAITYCRPALVSY